MNLMDDFNEFLRVWKGAPWTVKIVLALSFLLTFSSLASLSQEVANWKGFLLTGLMFYEEYIRDPIFFLVSKLTTLQFTDTQADTLLLTILCVSAWAKYLIFRMQQGLDENDKLVIVFVTIILVFCIWLLSGSLTQTVSPVVEQVWDTFLFQYIAIVYLFFIALAFVIDSDSGAAIFRLWLLAPAVLVCCFAAVNLGLNS